MTLHFCPYTDLRSDTSSFSGYNPAQRGGHRERPERAGGAAGRGPQGGRDSAPAGDQQTGPPMATG